MDGDKESCVANPMPNVADANSHQLGGDHYLRFGNLQPWDVITHFGLGFLDGNAVKYLLRWRYKGEGVTDLEKARHYIDKLIEITESEGVKEKEKEQ